MDKVSRVGIDLAKKLFHVTAVDDGGTVLERKRLRRTGLQSYLSMLPTGCAIALEACGGAHHWGRLAIRHGHKVLMMSPQFVVPYVKGQSYQDTSLRHSKIKVFLSRIRRRRGFLLVQSQRDGYRVKRIGRYHPRRALAGLTGGDNATPD